MSIFIFYLELNKGDLAREKNIIKLSNKLPTNCVKLTTITELSVAAIVVELHACATVVGGTMA